MRNRKPWSAPIYLGTGDRFGRADDASRRALPRLLQCRPATFPAQFGAGTERHQAVKRSRFSEEQIIGILKEHAAGLTAAELCRKHGISDVTFYKWRSKYGGMEVSEAKRLKALAEENAKLKKLLAESMLDVSTLREMLGKNF